MRSAEEWQARTERFLACDAELRQGIAISNGLDAIRFLVCLIAAVLGLGIYWHDLSARSLVTIAIGVFALRCVIGIGIYYFWSKPTLARIEAKYPEEKR